MQVKNGRHTNKLLTRPLRKTDRLGRDYYLRRDPDFNSHTYAQDFPELRQKIKPGDIIFFRTLHINLQYIFAYMTIGTKTGPADNPILVGDPLESRVTTFCKNTELDKETAMLLNERITFNGCQPFNRQLYDWFGSNYYQLPVKGAEFLKALITNLPDIRPALTPKKEDEVYYDPE